MTAVVGWARRNLPHADRLLMEREPRGRVGWPGLTSPTRAGLCWGLYGEGNACGLVAGARRMGLTVLGDAPSFPRLAQR